MRIFTSAGRKGGQVPTSAQETKFKGRLARNGRLKKRLATIDKKLKTLEQHKRQEQMMRKQLRKDYRGLRQLS